jgi:hypothetical protein
VGADIETLSRQTNQTPTTTKANYFFLEGATPNHLLRLTNCPLKKRLEERMEVVTQLIGTKGKNAKQLLNAIINSELDDVERVSNQNNQPNDDNDE